MGLRQAVRRSTVADANERRDWRIKKLLGTSENAVKTLVWCAIATYVLIAIVKKELHLDTSLYTCLQILSVSVFEKTLISCALQPDDYKTQPLPDANQLVLLGFRPDSSGIFHMFCPTGTGIISYLNNSNLLVISRLYRGERHWQFSVGLLPLGCINTG